MTAKWRKVRGGVCAVPVCEPCKVFQAVCSSACGTPGDVASKAARAGCRLLLLLFLSGFAAGSAAPAPSLASCAAWTERRSSSTGATPRQREMASNDGSDPPLAWTHPRGPDASSRCALGSNASLQVSSTVAVNVQLSAVPVSADGGYEGPVVCGDGTLLCLSWYDRPSGLWEMAVVYADNATVRWRYAQAPVYRAAALVSAYALPHAPAGTPSLFLVRQLNMNLAVVEGWDVWAGTRVWNRTFTFGAPANAVSPSLTPDASIMIVSLPYSFAALRTDNGALLWLKVPLPYGISNVQVIYVNATFALVFARATFESVLMMLDVQTGYVAWQFNVLDSTQLFSCAVLPRNTSTVVCAFNGALVAYSTMGNGTKLWQRPGFFGSNVVCSRQGLVYVSDSWDVRILALNGTSGVIVHQRFFYPRDPSMWLQPVLVDAQSRMYALTATQLWAFDPDLSVRWNVSTTLSRMYTQSVALMQSGSLAILTLNATLVVWAAQPAPSASPSSSPTPSRSPAPSRRPSPSVVPPPPPAPGPGTDPASTLPQLTPLAQRALIALAVSLILSIVLLFLIMLRRRVGIPLVPRRTFGCCGATRRTRTDEEIARLELQLELRIFALCGLVGAVFAGVYYYCVWRRMETRIPGSAAAAPSTVTFRGAASAAPMSGRGDGSGNLLLAPSPSLRPHSRATLLPPAVVCEEQGTVEARLRAPSGARL